MRRTLALSLTFTLSLGLLSGCGRASAAQALTAEPIALSQQELTAQDPQLPAVYAALSDFGLTLLQDTREAEGGPVLLSPLSVALALSMAANGAEGDTLAQLTQVLGGGTELEALNAACQTLTQDYQSLGGSTECSIANSLWTDPEGMIREDFIGKCRGIFDAQVFSQELSDPSVVPAVNRWVDEHTSGMIPSILSEPFSENTAALLVNALYLKNTWMQPFEARLTGPREFTHQDGTPESLDFLRHSHATFPYLQTEDAQGVVLPYNDGRLAFFALMPQEGTNFEGWLGALDGEAFSQLLEGRTDTEFLTLALPKFEAEWSSQLQDILSALGLDLAFTFGKADFSLLGDDPNGYFLSQVIHAAKIEVNEKGTEAAAATVVEANAGSAPPPETGVTLIFDRPFQYGIVDLEAGLPLFLGTFE